MRSGLGVLRSACRELGAERAGSGSPDLPDLMHQEGRAHVEAGERGMSDCRCREELGGRVG